MDQELVDRARGALLGLAVGDAVGTTVEFMPRGCFEPVTDMVGGGPFRLRPGEWTDDTSMALCLADSLLEKQGFDPVDQLERYTRWRREGYLSSNGECFDIGNTVRDALNRFRETGDPQSGSSDPLSAGNGSIMRLVPVVLFFHPDHDAAIHHAGESSKTTHGAAECVDACRLFAAILGRALDGAAKPDLLSAAPPAEELSEGLRSIAARDYVDKSADEIRSSGYVVESLEAALWSFERSESFEEAILTATNLGGDADTTAAICGQVAGAHYGRRGIPERWLDRLAGADLIDRWAGQLIATGVPGS